MTDKVQTVRAALQEARSGLDNLLSNEEMAPQGRRSG